MDNKTNKINSKILRNTVSKISRMAMTLNVATEKWRNNLNSRYVQYYILLSDLYTTPLFSMEWKIIRWCYQSWHLTETLFYKSWRNETRNRMRLDFNLEFLNIECKSCNAFSWCVRDSYFFSAHKALT